MLRRQDFHLLVLKASHRSEVASKTSDLSMPRKVLPRREKIGAMKVPTFTLSEEQLTELSSLLGLSASDVLLQLKATLEWIGARYLLWFQQDERGPSQAERNAALKQLLGTPQDLEPILAQLDYATRGELLGMNRPHLHPYALREDQIWRHAW